MPINPYFISKKHEISPFFRFFRGTGIDYQFRQRMSDSPSQYKKNKNPQNSVVLNAANLGTYSTDELKSILKQIQSEHDIMEVKNQELATHISDMRNVIKHVEKEKAEELKYMLDKKAKLEDEISRCQAALKVSNDNKNTMYQDMVAFKNLNLDQ